MLVQSTRDLARGTCGPVCDVSPLEGLMGLRDALAAGEVSTVQAVSKLTALLSYLSLSTVSTHGCGECLKPGCQDSECISFRQQTSWTICQTCEGSGYLDFDSPEPCVACKVCFNGLVEVIEGRDYEVVPEREIERWQA